MTGRQANDLTRSTDCARSRRPSAGLPRKIAAVEASTPGEARERLLGDIEALDFLLGRAFWRAPSTR